jgi:hypothetical protein
LSAADIAEIVTHQNTGGFPRSAAKAATPGSFVSHADECVRLAGLTDDLIVRDQVIPNVFAVVGDPVWLRAHV